MYLPKANAVESGPDVLELLRRAGAGHVVSFVDGTFDATLMPFLVDDELRVVRGHVARANPQWRTLDGRSVLMVVPVTDAYVSPAWYPSKREDPKVVPTWNYEVVHMHATAVVHDDPVWVEQLVRDLTAAREAVRIERADDAETWSVDDAPGDFIARQLRAIVGIELLVDSIDAKRKLSQNRSVADQAEVSAALAGSKYDGDRAVARSMLAE